MKFAGGFAFGALVMLNALLVVGLVQKVIERIEEEKQDSAGKFISSGPEWTYTVNNNPANGFRGKGTCGGTGG